MNTIIDFSDQEYSYKHGSYGGHAGDKDGILYNGQCYMLKYPRPAYTLDHKVNVEYLSTPLSEYIGSHIYQILDIPVHETLLGYKDGQIVVACKDFCAETSARLLNFSMLKNAAHKELIETKIVPAPDPYIDLYELRMHLSHNPICRQVPGITDHIWDMVVVDILINNNDRNANNWGLLLYEDLREYQIAPVFDNGNAFYPKHSDDRLKDKLKDGSNKKFTDIQTPYTDQGQILSGPRFIKANIPELKKSILKNVPKILNKNKAIKAFIDGIPEEYNGIHICSKIRKEYYYKSMQARISDLLLPIYLYYDKHR